jgi:medium-chain acyl-[acyl-carrier-protein] hydrolase
MLQERHSSRWISKSKSQLAQELKRVRGGGRSAQHRVILYCFPYAGGGATVYHEWFKLLPSWVEVCPVELPGRHGRMGETPIGSMKRMVEELHQSLFSERMWPQCDFALFGHSMGSWIALALSRHLSSLEKGRVDGDGATKLKPNRGRLVCTIVSGKHPPASRGMGLSDADRKGLCIEERLSVLSDKDLWQRWGERHLDTGMRGIDNGEREIFCKMLKADCGLLEEYEDSCLMEEQPRLSGRLCAMSALDDPGVSQENFELWRHFTEGECTVSCFKHGGHQYIFQGAPDVRLEAFSCMTKALEQMMTQKHS